MDSDPLQSARHRARRQRNLTLPSVVFIALTGLLPLLVVVAISLMKADIYGGVHFVFSADAYKSLLFQQDIFDNSLTFSWAYLEIFLRTLSFAALTTLFSVLIGFPTAYFIATRPPRERNRWVLLVTIPFWSNLLVRNIAIMFLIRDNGPINSLLMGLGVISHPLPILFSNTGILAGLIYSFLPFMVLPIYAALERLDVALVEAASDLYAPRARIQRHIVLPLAWPGIVTGCVLVFIPAFGAYVTPLILGGGRHMMMGDLIALQFGSSRNWPLGAALSVVLIVATIALLALNRRRIRAEDDHA